MEDSEVELEELIIAPLERSMVRGAFSVSESDFQNLIDWFKTAAIISQDERKCKVYVAQIDGAVVGFISLSMALPEEPIAGLPNRSSFAPQMVLIGKLYTHPDYRSRGIGNKLMEFTLDMAIKIDEMVGCIGIIVDANINPRTVSFYQRFGFEEISRTTRTVKMFFKIPEQPVGPEIV